MMTVQELIDELQSLPEEQKKLPVKFHNGSEYEAVSLTMKKREINLTDRIDKEFIALI